MFRLNNVRCQDIIKVGELCIEEGIITCQGEALHNQNAVLLRREVTFLPQVPVIFPGTVRDRGFSFNNSHVEWFIIHV